MATAADLYSRYLAAPDEAAARAALDELFSTWMIAWCREAVDRNLGCYGLRDVDRIDLASDVVAEILLAITVRLQASRTGESEPVTSLRAYLSSTAQNACFGRIRARCPHHVQLQNRIRYLLRNDVRFAVWTTSTGDALAGRADWLGQEEQVNCPELQRSNQTLDALLDALFTLAAGPVRVTDLVRTLAATLGISDSSGPQIDPDSLPGRDRSVHQNLAEREQLGALWEEVRSLPPQQRAALLLNLRDPAGSGVIELLPVTGVASYSEIAELLTMTEQKLAELWDDLPLEDSRIAALLNLTRQQVINLRKSARDRLVRRMRKLEGNTDAALASSENRGLLRRLANTVFQRKGSK